MLAKTIVWTSCNSISYIIKKNKNPYYNPLYTSHGIWFKLCKIYFRMYAAVGKTDGVCLVFSGLMC